MKYKAHFFICTHSRVEGAACGTNSDNAQKIREQIKAQCKKLWPTEVRINMAGCLGHCEKGVVAVLYPSSKWYFELTESKIPEILEDIEKIISKSK